MNHSKTTQLRRFALCVAVTAIFVAAPLSHAADSGVQVQLNTQNGKPRVVEELTDRGILRDYRFAWTSMAQALEFNTVDALEGPFAGDAKQWLKDTIVRQQQSGISQRYLEQKHKVDAVFYAPEGDVMELHDTAEYQLQVSDAGKMIHDERVVMHYVVLMTPGADRWIIRQLQAVPQF
jgi:hemin uptake protein HemP